MSALPPTTAVERLGSLPCRPGCACRGAGPLCLLCQRAKLPWLSGLSAVQVASSTPLQGPWLSGLSAVQVASSTPLQGPWLSGLSAVQVASSTPLQGPWLSGLSAVQVASSTPLPSSYRHKSVCDEVHTKRCQCTDVIHLEFCIDPGSLQLGQSV